MNDFASVQSKAQNILEDKKVEKKLDSSHLNEVLELFNALGVLKLVVSAIQKNYFFNSLWYVLF